MTNEELTTCIFFSILGCDNIIIDNGCYQTTGGLWQITGKCRGRDSER